GSALCFLQAEDGIRDDLVTGVQTCALPIWRHPCCGVAVVEKHALEELCDVVDDTDDASVLHSRRTDNTDASHTSVADVERRSDRSEERRVGKVGNAGGRATPDNARSVTDDG